MVNAPHDDHGHGDEELAPGKSLADKLYVPAIVRGIRLTMKHFFGTIKSEDACVQYPEEGIYDEGREDKAIGHPNPRYRGEHILVKDELGREKCVACLLCMAACPALCIHIEPAPAPADWGPDRERRPAVFEIDMLRCIYCGFCEEACPCDAIRLTPKFYTPTTSRVERVYGKQRLLENNPAAQIPQRPAK